MKASKRRIRRFGPESGQAMTEAAIMGSLLCFVWAMIMYTNFMAVNLVQTASAARMQAWMAGSDIQRQNVDFWFDTWFFTKRGFSNSSASDRVVVNPRLKLDPLIKLKLFQPDPFIYKDATVRFGFQGFGSRSRFPFSLMKTRFPFMKRTRLLTWLRVSTDCSWAEISDPWADTNNGWANSKAGRKIKEIIDKILD
jgi:hypothetical protein